MKAKIALVLVVAIVTGAGVMLAQTKRDRVAKEFMREKLGHSQRVLEGIVTQTLLPKARGKGRALACEILVITPAIRALIRDDKVHQIYSLMQSGKKFGMQTLNDALYQLYVSREVTEDECLRVSGDPNELMRMLGRDALTDDASELKTNQDRRHNAAKRSA